jgi:3-(3-hydroxy-phenyl)propionate hydroxylase
MCAGIRDAHNLCWKLGLVLRGQAHSALLESYQQEREPHARTTITLTVNFGKIIQARQLLAMLRDSILPLLAHVPGAFSMHAPPLTAGLLMHTLTEKQKLCTRIASLFASMARKRTSAQGTLLPQPIVRSASGAHVLLDEVLGPSFVIIGLNINPRSCLDSMALAFWDDLSTRFVQVTAPDNDDESVTHVEDSEKQLADWFARQQGTIAVVRPDRYIFGIFTAHSLHRATRRLQTLLEES